MAMFVFPHHFPGWIPELLYTSYRNTLCGTPHAVCDGLRHLIRLRISLSNGNKNLIKNHFCANKWSRWKEFFDAVAWIQMEYSTSALVTMKSDVDCSTDYPLELLEKEKLVIKDSCVNELWWYQAFYRLLIMKWTERKSSEWQRWKKCKTNKVLFFASSMFVLEP